MRRLPKQHALAFSPGSHLRLRLLACHPRASLSQTPQPAQPDAPIPLPTSPLPSQAELGDIVYVELPEVGAKLTAGKTFGVVESVKARRAPRRRHGSPAALCPLGRR